MNAFVTLTEWPAVIPGGTDAVLPAASAVDVFGLDMVDFLVQFLAVVNRRGLPSFTLLGLLALGCTESAPPAPDLAQIPDFSFVFPGQATDASGDMAEPPNIDMVGSGTDQLAGDLIVGPKKPRVLIVSVDRYGMTVGPQLQMVLAHTGAFSVVDDFEVHALADPPPTVQKLQGYDVVLLWGYWGDTTQGLSANLAVYYDGGGRVVVMGRELEISPVDNRGGFLQPQSGYLVLFDCLLIQGSYDLLINDPNSPLMAGVHMVSEPGVGEGCSLGPGAVPVAHWGTMGQVLGVAVAVGVVKGRNRVDIDLDPSQLSGDGVTLLKNALLYQ